VTKVELFEIIRKDYFHQQKSIRQLARDHGVQPTPEEQDLELQRVIMESMGDQKGFTAKKQRIEDSSSHQQGTSGSGSASSSSGLSASSSSSSVGSSPFILLPAPPTSQHLTQPVAQRQELSGEMSPG
jgi:hypothetical protein